MKKNVIVLNRKGWIDTDLTAPNQCKGIGWNKYTYEVSITAREDNTDAQEFIIDNSIIHFAILKCFQKFMTSCEGMVKKVAKCLLKVCKKHGTKVLDMHIVIKPREPEKDHSFAWFEWKMKH